ncbi:DUF4962 domain-containing protein [Ructibacterium gallinarum]|uniref:DUF4962 domain-containing protein n=1 Tax=Ructibacterium gallinarum TaxID=2779355 RepID=A0A9D5R9E9_9FIRM|nr:DUF4962 domain-containing protein [Ructibacterium gallinarum]MBE5040419.1 DUF4962 domain-containing protein [Ructibacterium gallinarum]
MKLKARGCLIWTLLVTFLSAWLPPFQVVASDAKIIYENHFEESESLQELNVFGNASTYVNSGMLKMRIASPKMIPEESGFFKQFEEPIWPTEARPIVMELQILCGTTANVKNLFVVDGNIPLVILDNGNAESEVGSVGIIANTASGNVVLKACPSLREPAFSANVWYHICVVLYEDNYDVYFDGQKLNQDRLLLPEGITQISTVGCKMKSWNAETILIDNFWVYQRAEAVLNAIEKRSRTEAVMRFSYPIDKESITNISVSSAGRTIEYIAQIQPDLHTVVLTFAQSMEDGATYQISYTGVQDIFGTPINGEIWLFQEEVPVRDDRFIDELNAVEEGVNHVVSYTKKANGSPAFYFDRSNPANYCGDESRIFLDTNLGPSEIVYYFPEGVDSCRITTFEADRAAPPKYEVLAEVSADGSNYMPVQLQRAQDERKPEEAGFSMYTYSCETVEANNVYFKLILQRAEEDETSSSAWTPKVASVEINCLAASGGKLIASTPVPGTELAGPNTKIRLTYSQVLNPATLSNSFTMNGDPVEAVLEENEKTVTLITDPLEFGREYEVTSSTSLCTVEGAACSPATLRFSTAEHCAVTFYDSRGKETMCIPDDGIVTPVVETNREILIAACIRRDGQLEAIQTKNGSGEIVFSPFDVSAEEEVWIFFWDGSAKMCPVASSVRLDRSGVTEAGANAGVVSDLFQDMSQISASSGILQIETDMASAYDGDTERLTGENGSFIVYKLPAELKGIQLLYYTDRGLEGTISVQGSADGEEYRLLPCEIQSINRIITHPMQACEMYEEIPDGIRYVRIYLDDQSALGTLNLFYGDYDMSAVKKLQNELGYDYGEGNVQVPNWETVQTLVQEKTQGEHPRLMAEKEDFDRVRANANKEPYRQWLQSMKKYADDLGGIDTYSPVSFVQTSVESEKKDFLNQIREIKKRVETLACLWQITGDKVYAECCWKELENTCGFPTLYPEHFLNVGEGSLALAVGYDWLYDYLMPERRQILEDGIIRLGISQALPYMRSGSGFVNNTNNWNSVCNGGIGVAALCFAERRDDCAEAVAYAVQYMMRGFYALAPEGAYPEGPGYWDFGTEYMVYFLSALQTAAGESFGLENMLGMNNTGFFPLYMTSPIGKTFNFADSGDNMLWAPQQFWLAKQYQQPAQGYLETLTEEPQAYDLLWYDFSYIMHPAEAGLSLNKVWSGAESIAVFRQNWTDKNALYAAIKGGDNQSSHGDLDIGTFVLDAMGLRWAEELGAAYYHSDGYWESDAAAGRWTYYRKRAEGHNTLVMNPGQGPDQNVYATAEMGEITETDDGASAVLDMSAAYSEYAESAKRRLTTFHDSTEVLLQDWVTCETEVDLFWFLQTPASVSISENGRTAVLQQQGKTLKIRIAEPAGAVFEVERAQPLPESPHPAGDLLGHNRLSIHLPNVSSAKIAVVFTPIWDLSYEDTEFPDIQWDF